MNAKNSIKYMILGWLPKEPSMTYAVKTLKYRWRKSFRVAFATVALIAVVSVVYFSVQTYLRYSNPQMDITASYYEKTLNCSTANVGDIVEVRVLVGWHGYIVPEFKRAVKIFDPFPDNNFELIGGNNTCYTNGYGGSYQLQYLLKVAKADHAYIELPKPLLYLDTIKVPLQGVNAVLELQNFTLGG